ncbi:MAG: PhoH family protein [Elusimicrobiota bacterium]
MNKSFVLDTNVLIHDPGSLYNFEDNEVVLPLTVIEELDKLKKLSDERGRNARLITRRLDNLRNKGKLFEGVKTDKGGIIRIEADKKADIPTSLVKKADNEILAVALGLKESGKNVIFISKDINMRVKAEVLGLEVQDFEKAKVRFEELYSGWRELEVKDNLVDEFLSQKKMPIPADIEKQLSPQEFIKLRSQSDNKKTGLGRYSPREDLIVKLTHAQSRPWGLKALNVEQQFAFEAMLNDDIELVTLLGVAGTGKTLIALACGLHLTFDEKKYRRVMISRPVVPMGKDIGYLPGSKEEKLANWMGAFYDNLEFLVEESGKTFGKSKKNNVNLKPSDVVDNLFDTGKIEIEALTYLRGRSIPQQFMIIDEAQNLTPLEIKTIVSRAGKNTKVVVTGDPYQIDNPYLDSASNGLTYLAERFKGQDIFAHVTLSKSERSNLAGLAAELL